MGTPFGIENPMTEGSDIVFDTSADVDCPHCGELISITVDPGGGPTQDYVEDCEVCCRPWSLQVRYASDGSVSVQVDITD